MASLIKLCSFHIVNNISMTSKDVVVRWENGNYLTLPRQPGYLFPLSTKSFRPKIIREYGGARTFINPRVWQ